MSIVIVIGPSKSVLVYALHSLENVLGPARYRVFVNLAAILKIICLLEFSKNKFNKTL